jgi:hypothetical protein
VSWIVVRTQRWVQIVTGVPQPSVIDAAHIEPWVSTPLPPQDGE